MNFRQNAASLIVLAMLMLLGATAVAQDTALKIDYQKYKLDNGLEVILHEDRSDPITAVAILFHVGSNREEVGRTGFAHLFEHMLFQESQHVGQDQFFRKIQGAGGTLNGGTWEDGTIYYEVVPKNALEMVLWLESDRMGFLLPTVTMEAFQNQQNVVQNEKRQRVDNVPYGHTNYVIHKLMYPEQHPYNWQVIGSFEDLQNATIEDIHNFYKKWYGPNNATLVIAGDYDEAQTKAWVQKYFGELKASPAVAEPKAMPVSLTETKRAFHEDNFAQSPEMNMVFPTAPQFKKDSYALDLLGDLLSQGKKAPLYKVLVEEKQLAPDVSARQNSSEIAGDFRIRVRAFPTSDLDDVEKAVKEAFTRFETEKFTEDDLARIKARTETNFYNGINSVFTKAFQLAYYNEYAGSPDFITNDIQNTLDVTSADIWAVYNKYLKDKPYVITSFVPAGKPELTAENSDRFPVVEEKIEEESADATTETASMASDFVVEKMPTAFDRTVEPAKGPAPEITIPAVWEHSYKNGLKVYGIENSELPLVEFSMTLKGGTLLDDLNKMGVANLVSDVMMEGTKNKTPQELEEAIEKLGASIRISTGRESITFTVNSLASKFDQVFALFQEMLLEPRWDEKEFARIKQETIEGIQRNSVNPSAVAGRVFRRLVYGNDNVLGRPVTGDVEDVENITIADLKAYYSNYFSPSVANVCIAGALGQKDAVKHFEKLAKKWQKKEVKFPEFPAPQMTEKTQLYFVDIPNAKQSQVFAGHLGLAETDADYHAASVMNYRLGGSFNGILNMILREEKGYTYGARSFFTGSINPGFFLASSGVKSNVTLESAQIVKEEIGKYLDGISEEDLMFTKDALIQSNTRRLETLDAQRSMLEDIAMYGKPVDFIKKEAQVTRNMTTEQHQMLAKKYIHPDKMVYLIVGDAATQAPRMTELGIGEPVMLDTKGNTIESE